MADSLTYNNVELAIIYEKEIGRKHIYTPDQTTYLWTEWVFDVRATVNPQVISYIETGTPAKGNLPATTDKVIRSLLNQPRKSLRFVQNGIEVLRTPRVNEVTDAHLGPFVETFDLRRDIAGKTWIVEMRIVARVRECPRNPGPVLISNRWTRIMDTDEDYISSILTFGECVFDSASLLSLGTYPDQYRIDLLQPIPQNCKRDNINVTAMSDGCTLKYSFRDQERHFNTRPATRIEVYQTEFYAQTSLESAMIDQGLQAIPNIMGGVFNLSPGTVVNSMASGLFNAIRQSIPKYYTHLLCRCWGDRGTPKNQILNQALGMAFERVNKLRNVEFIVSRDLNGKWVEVQLTTRSGPEEISVQFINGVANVLGPIFPELSPVLQAALPQGTARVIANSTTTETSPGLYAPAGTPWYTQDPFFANRPPPASGDTRGSLLQKIVAQSLHDPCQLPPQALAIGNTEDKRLY